MEDLKDSENGRQIKIMKVHKCRGSRGLNFYLDTCADIFLLSTKTKMISEERDVSPLLFGEHVHSHEFTSGVEVSRTHKSSWMISNQKYSCCHVAVLCFFCVNFRNSPCGPLSLCERAGRSRVLVVFPGQ